MNSRSAQRISTIIPLFTVTFADARGVHVELYDSEADARARREAITGRVVLASHQLRIGR